MIIALFKSQIPVEVLDVYRGADGKLAVVKALAGKPFIGGDKWPIWTEFATVSIALLDAVYPVEVVGLAAARLLESA